MADSEEMPERRDPLRKDRREVRLLGSDKMPESVRISQEKAATLLSRDLAYKLTILPLSFENNLLLIGMVNPSDEDVLSQVQIQTRTDVQGRKLDVKTIRDGLIHIYPHVVRRIETPVETLFQNIAQQAMTMHASDIHIEPIGPNGGEVRLRVDNALLTTHHLESETYRRLLAYCKVKSGVDVSEQIMPLDGRIRAVVDSRAVHMRLGIVSGIFGQKVALRVLGQFELMGSLKESGISASNITRLTNGVARAGAFIIIAGPTGSGKTTLLFSLLRQLDLRALNVYSVEDPVEIPVETMTQVAVNEKAGLTFAENTRSFVRQDPDLLLIGELRDAETVNECLAASTTGLNLLTTTHAKSAIHIIDRLVELGATRDRVAATLTMGVSQRLVRRLCRYCKTSTTLSSRGDVVYHKFLATISKDNVAAADPSGCLQCVGGYSGRFGIIEVLDVTHEIQAVMKTSGSAHDIARQAATRGYEPMIVDGLRHVLLGETSEDELLKKLAYEDMVL